MNEDEDSGEFTEDDMDKAISLGMTVGFYGYHYMTVHGLSHIERLRQDELAVSEGPVAGMLADLFAKHSIREVSLAPLQKALRVADRWLETGVVDENEAAEAIGSAEALLVALNPVLLDIYRRSDVDENFIGAPLVLTSIGTAIELVQDTLALSKDYEMNSPEEREPLRNRIRDAMAKKEVAKQNPEAAPGNTPS